MPINRVFRPIYTKRIPNSIFFLVVEKVDFELKLYDNYGLRFSVDKNQLSSILNSDWPILNLRNRYLIRYNNNDNGIGFLNVKIFQKIPNNDIIELDRMSYNNIQAPTVFEIPFYLQYEV